LKLRITAIAIVTAICIAERIAVANGNVRVYMYVLRTHLHSFMLKYWFVVYATYLVALCLHKNNVCANYINNQSAGGYVCIKNIS